MTDLETSRGGALWPRRTRAHQAPAQPFTVPLVLVVAAVVAGLIVRVVVMRTSLGVLDSDEAVVGLMARHFQSGAYRAFFWGQTYGGTIETGITAIVFQIFGPSVDALKAVPLVLNGAAALLVWRVGRRVVSPGSAVVAAIVVWLWPANYLWWSVKARGFYEVTLCLTLASALLVLRIAQESGHRWGDWALLGLCAGLGWWQSPQIVYILAPVGVWIIAVRRTAVWPAVVAIPTFILGALPWLVANLNSDFASLSPPSAAVKGTYTDHLVQFAKEGLPTTLGLKVVYLSRWMTSPVACEILYAAAVATVVYGCVRHWRGAVLLALVIVAYPFLNSILTLSGMLNEGRYTLFLLPWLVFAMTRATTNRPLATSALVAVAVVVTAYGLSALRGETSPYAPDRRVPTSMVALEHSLHDHNITRVWAHYWIAYRLTFETRELVIAAPVLSGRYAPYQDAVANAPDPAFVFIASSRDASRFRRGLDARHIGYTAWNVGSNWTVVLPRTKVGPTTIPDSYL